MFDTACRHWLGWTSQMILRKVTPSGTGNAPHQPLVFRLLRRFLLLALPAAPRLLSVCSCCNPTQQTVNPVAIQSQNTVITTRTL